MANINIVAEIGINHNGDLNIAKKLIALSKSAGCDYVKFQKRNPEVCVPDDQKGKIKSTPWGDMTYLDYKWKIEFSEEDYVEIDSFCEQQEIKWFASAWDLDSVNFLKKFENSNSYANIIKIPSALITDINLCEYAKVNSRKLIISTGMSTEKEIETCINSCNPDVIMHTNSTYPCPVTDLNLNYINWLKNKYKNVDIGYSGHEYGLVTTFSTVTMGVSWIERHVTLDRNMWGSDQSASIEPSGLFKLVKGVREIELALSIPAKPREIFGGELDKMVSLRNNNNKNLK